MKKELSQGQCDRLKNASVDVFLNIIPNSYPVQTLKMRQSFEISGHTILVICGSPILLILADTVHSMHTVQ